MTDQPEDLDSHRGMAAQKATVLRRELHEVAADRARIKRECDELERHLVAAPATSWEEAVDQASYLLTLFAETNEAQDPRRKLLIQRLLQDFATLLRSNTTPGSGLPNDPA